MKIIKSLITIFLLISVFVISQNDVYAQTSPLFMVSWKAYDFIPPGFYGKSIPINGTPVDISFEILQNDGKIADISKNMVKFFVNGQKRGEGMGLRRFRFFAANTPAQEIKFLVLDQLGDVQFENRFAIPTTNPEIVIYPPRPQNLIERGVNYFQAIPYFFNVSRINDLRLTWTVNNVSPPETSENPDQLELAIPQEYPPRSNIAVGIAAQNKLKELEIASQTSNFTVQ